MQNILASITNKSYCHVFTSLKTALFKKFQSSILNQSYFTDYFHLIVIDKIYFIGEWGKNFWPIYDETKEFKKRILCHLFLFKVLAMLTKSIYLKVIKKAGFLSNYWFIQITLDYQDIIQIYYFIKYYCSNCLNF